MTTKLFEQDKYYFIPHRGIRHIFQLIMFLLLNGGLWFSVTWLVLPINQPPTSLSVADGAMYTGIYMIIEGVVPFLIIGLIFLIGGLVGRMFCGWVCPFGFIQDLLAFIPFKKYRPTKDNNESFSDIAKIMLLVVLAFSVFLGIARVTDNKEQLQSVQSSFGVFAVDPMGAIDPYATLVGYFPFLSLDVDWSNYSGLNDIIGFDFWVWARLLLFLFAIIGAMLIPRFWCRYFCITGAAMGKIGKNSQIGLERNIALCTNCGICEDICPMDVRILDHPSRIRDSMCISCGDCIAECPEGALSMTFGLK